MILTERCLFDHSFLIFNRMQNLTLCFGFIWTLDSTFPLLFPSVHLEFFLLPLFVVLYFHCCHFHILILFGETFRIFHTSMVSKLSISLSLLNLAMNFLKFRDRLGFIIFCYLIVNSINFNYLIFRVAYVFERLNSKILMLY